MLSLDQIIDNFELIDDWEERYRYLIELGRELEPMPADAHTDANRVRGCASQVWLETHLEQHDRAAILSFKGDSDAFIVKGLIYVVLALYSGRPAAEIVSIDAAPLFERLGLQAHLTPQRSNGLRAMVERIKSDARQAGARPTQLAGSD